MGGACLRSPSLAYRARRTLASGSHPRFGQHATLGASLTEARRHAPAARSHATVSPDPPTLAARCSASALAHEQTGQATLGSEEPGETLCLTMELSEGGKGTLQGSLATTDATRRLTFQDIDIDHAFIHDALASFEEILETFPVRGDPHAD